MMITNFVHYDYICVHYDDNWLCIVMITNCVHCDDNWVHYDDN
jgi:hypothetical protein